MWNRPLPVAALYGLIVGAMGFCSVAQVELYPFAPFSFYSEHSSGPVHLQRVVANLKSGGAAEVRRFGAFNALTLESIIVSDRKKYDQSFDHASELLSATIQWCRQQPTCRPYSAQLGSSIEWAQVRSFQVMEYDFAHLTIQNRQTPDASRMLAEARL